MWCNKQKNPDRMNQVHIKSMQPTNMQVDSNKEFLLRTMFWISFFSVHVHHINWHMIIRMLTFAIQTVQWFLPFRKERNSGFMKHDPLEIQLRRYTALK